MDVLLDQQDRSTLPLQLGDGLEDSFDHQGSQAQRRLVEQQQARPAHQGPADRQHLLLATRQGPARLPEALLQQREELEHHLEIGPDSGSV